LYVEATQRLYFINKASRTVVGELNRNDISIEERIEIAEQGMSVVAQDAFENGEISKEIADISKACIESINNVVNEVPDVRKLLGMLLENQSGYCYKHSIITTFLANQIIGKISWGSAEQQEKVAFSLFFHDIYLIEIYKKYPEATSEEDLLFIEGMLESEKQTIIDHAKMAGDLVKSFPRCPMGADTIITQHHGMTSGQGFAINYKDDISPLAKIMIIAEDIAVSLLSQTETRGKITIDKEKVCGKLNEKYRNHTYKKVIKAFQEAKI
ncbi:MAG: hypothetical protein HON90_17445, partial [Halobacteriovoraceae bacterium]|nr:hypothetical protein [Halobacteriovoraceae bacterium]